MYVILNLFKQKPIPKFQQKLINFEKPQNFSKTPKPRFKTWNACKWEIRSLPSEEKLVKAWRNPEEEVWSEWERFGRWKDETVEREIEKNENQIAHNLYIKVQ